MCVKREGDRSGGSDSADKQGHVFASYFSTVVLMKLNPNINGASCLYASLYNKSFATFLPAAKVN